MTGFLSIIWRELTVGARQRATYRGRLIAGATMLVLFAAFVLLSQHPPNQLGPMLFAITSMLLFLQALLSGVRLTADSLSEEKRDGTLGLLFLTELRAFEVVLAKMAARSLRALYALIATLPVFTFCILMGGIRGLDSIYIAILLLTVMLFSLAVGVFVSAQVTEDKAAFLGTLGLLAAFTLLPLLLWKICSTLTAQAPWCDYLLYPSPAYAYTAVPWTAAPSAIAEFWGSILVLNLLSGALAIAAAILLRKSFQQQFVATSPPAKTPAPADEGVTPIPASKTLETNPFRWLLEREKLFPKIMRAFLALTIILALIGTYSLQSKSVGALVTVLMYTLYGLHVLWKILLTSDVVRRLHHDHRSGSLELLLSTPLAVREILKAQRKHTFRLFFPSAIALCLASAVMFSHGFLNDMLALPIGGALFLFIDAQALAWMGILQALRPGRYPAAVLRITGLVLGPPLALILLLLFTRRGMSSYDANALFFFWFIACAIYDFILIHNAKKKVFTDFRLLAADAPTPGQQKRRTLPKPLQWLLLTEPAPADVP